MNACSMQKRIGQSYGKCGRSTTPEAKKKWTKDENPKTYNSRDSLMVTHSTTNLPIWCLCMAERTGCPFLTSLWSYVTAKFLPGTIYSSRRWMSGTRLPDFWYSDRACLQFLKCSDCCSDEEMSEVVHDLNFAAICLLDLTSNNSRGLVIMAG